MQPSRELDDARVLRRGVLSELRIYLGASRIELRRGVDRAELDVIERIVEFGSKLHVQPLTNRKILE